MSTATAPASAAEMYRDGTPVPAITAATGLTEHQIAAAVTLAEQPTAPAPVVIVRPKTLPADTAADSIEDLLAWAEQHDAKGVRGLAGRARDAIAQLRTRKAGDQVLTAAEREVERLEKQLADARAKLRKARTGRTPTASAEHTGPWPAEPTPAQLRAWAKQAGLDCHPHGSVPRSIADAYHQARTAQSV